MTHHTGDQKQVNCSQILLSELMSKRLKYAEWKHDPTCMKFYKSEHLLPEGSVDRGDWDEA